MAKQTAGAKLKVGILGCSAFALRAMGPAVKACPHLQLTAIASRDALKAEAAASKLGCQAVEGYDALIGAPEIDVIYMPLPTGLHLDWGIKCLNAGKHLLIEKSLASNFEDARALVSTAESRGLALLENFLFLRHSQFAWVGQSLAEGAIGNLRFLRAAFTIPALDDGNFRYACDLGGGALLDVGAYMVKTVAAFLGSRTELMGCTMQTSSRRKVDIGGGALYAAEGGVCAEVAWGFDCHYQCSWDLTGDAGRIVCSRALTPPPGFKPTVRVESSGKADDLELKADDHYINQWNYFVSLVKNPEARDLEYRQTLAQAEGLQLINDRAVRRTIP